MERFESVLRWPVREGLLAYIEVLKEDAATDFRFQVLAYRIAGGKKPTLPKILEEKD